MHRRRLLTGLGSAATAAFAGCTGGASGVTNDTQGNGSESVGDGSERIAAFRADLEAAGVDVDSSTTMLGGVSVLYWYDPEKHRQDIVRTAEVFVDYRGLVDTVLTMTAVMPDGESRHGYFTIPPERARRYDEGAISAETYHQQTIDTYTRV